jgi:superfamily II DNA helicase RecQ
MSERISADEWLAKYGRARIIECLVGADTESIRSARLNTLTTYGLLRAEGRNYVISLFREMEKTGLVKGVEKILDDGTTIPLLGLTLRGSQVMRGTATFKMEWPSASNAISVPRSRSRSRKNERESFPPDYDFRANEDDADEEVRVGEEIRRHRSPIVLPGKPKSHYRETLSLGNSGSTAGSAGTRRKKLADALRPSSRTVDNHAPGGAADDSEKMLLSKLRAKRAVIAKLRGGIPQFMVFHNTGIESLAKYRPKTVEEAIGLPGVSEKKREILAEFIETIRRYT